MSLGDKLVKFRKNKKLSTLDVANKLNINEQNVISWEKGKNIPGNKDIKSLASLYDVEVSELVDTSKLLDELESEKRFNIFKLVVILVLLLGLSIITSLFFHRERYQEMEVYNFKGESEHFKFKNGLIIMSRDNKFIDFGKFELKNIELKSATINVAFNETIWTLADYNIEDDGDAKEWFKDLDFTEYVKKARLLENADKQNSFSKYDNKFPNDFKVEVNYCTIDDFCTVEILKINAEKMNTSNITKK
jgi:transcriptional regulator with XRE-family HTH domain